MLRAIRIAALFSLAVHVGCTGGGEKSAPPSPVSAARSSLTAAPASVFADGSPSITLTATARDAAGAPLAGMVARFAASGSGNQLSAATATTNAAGVATVMLGSTKAEAKDVSAAIDGVAVAQHATATFVAGAESAAHSTLVAVPATAPDDGTPAALTATVQDAYGNPVQGATVTLSSSGGATLVQPGPTDASGLATGSASSLARGTETITATVGSTEVATADVTFTAAPPSASLSTVVTNGSSFPADGTSAATVTVTVRDTASRPMSGQTVTLAHSGDASISPSSATTGADGVATFHVAASSATSGNVTATVNPGAGQVIVASNPALGFVPFYGIGGKITGLTGDGLVLATPGQAGLAVTSGATTFAFPTPVVPGTAYAVTIVAKPAGMECGVVSPRGIIGVASVSSVTVWCSPAWAKVSAGDYHSVGIKTDGSLWAWGSGSSRTPILIGTGFATAAAGESYTLAVKTDGTLWAWGENRSGQLGDGTTDEPERARADRDGDRLVVGGGGRAATPWRSRRDGTLWTWGCEREWRSSATARASTSRPRCRSGPRPTGRPWRRALATRWPSRRDGTLWGWGYNWEGQVGDGTQTLRVDPVQIGTEKTGRRWRRASAIRSP